jgi:hypothetical protein
VLGEFRTTSRSRKKTEEQGEYRDAADIAYIGIISINRLYDVVEVENGGRREEQCGKRTSQSLSRVAGEQECKC